MNNLMQQTYFKESYEFVFSAGLPSGWTAVNYGSATNGTKDNTDAYGSQFYMTGTNTTDYVLLKFTGGLNPSIIKYVELELDELTITGSIQMLIGLIDSTGNYQAMINLISYSPNGSGNYQTSIMHQNGDSSHRTTSVIYDVNTGIVFTNADVGINVDIVNQLSNGHCDYSYASLPSTNFPVGQTLIPYIKMFNIQNGVASSVKFRKIKLNIYS